MLAKAKTAAFTLISLITIVSIGMAFGVWFALHQMHAVDIHASFLQSYPVSAFTYTILRCTLTITALYVLSHVALYFLSCQKLPSFVTALTFIPLLLVYSEFSLLTIVGIIVTLQCLGLVTVLRKQDYERLKNAMGVDILVFALLFGMHLLLTTQFSPLHLDMPIITGNDDIPIVASVYKQYILAKQFDFAYIDYSQWAAVMHPPITLGSPLLQIIALVFDLPAVSVEYFHTMMLGIMFLLIVLGSFGAYLFLRYTLKLRILWAIVGGIFMFFSGSPFFRMLLDQDGGVFLSSYIAFPYALLFINASLQKQKYMYAVPAGIALASPFFLFSPHPEGIMYTNILYAVFAGMLCVFEPKEQWSYRQKFTAVAISVMVFFLLSAYTILPIIWDSFTGNMQVFAHTGDITTSSLASYKRYAYLLLFFFPALFIKNDHNSARLSVIVLAGFIFFWMCATSLLQVNNFIVHALHLGIHLGGARWRIGLYLSFIVMSLAMITMDALMSLCLSWLDKKYPLTTDVKSL